MQPGRSHQLPRRPWRRPIGWRWSDFVIGRRLTLAALERDGVVTVSAYRCTASDQPGQIRYSDPVTAPCVKRGATTRYRIRVKLKKGAR